MEDPKRFQLVLLVLTFTLIEIAQGLNKLKVEMDYYMENTNDLSTKCIKLCVTSSPTGKPRCNLNTTTGPANVKPSKTATIDYPHPYEYVYSFSSWEHNSEISATVWKLPSGKTCDSSGPTNQTFYGIGHETIPRLPDQKRGCSIKDLGGKWILSVTSQIKCAGNTNCVPPCVPQDNDSGHYTCVDGNKKCFPKWYGRNCIKTYVSPSNPPTNYKYLSVKGVKGCLTNWFGTNCSKFCNETAIMYTCDKNGQKRCLANWYGINCSSFCNSSALTYNCSSNGDKVCLENWFDKYCSTFCNNSAQNYNCNENGEKVCWDNWFGENCSIFCSIESTRYRCSENGKKTCLPNWFDESKECSKFCDLNAANYKCTDTGERVCSPNWFGETCQTFCQNTSTRYRCLENGERECLRNWHGKNCSRYCDNNTAVTYTCTDTGEKICLRNWYGDSCDRFCDNNSLRYSCNQAGERVCHPNWFGHACSKFCNNSAKAYSCNERGEKACRPNWHGEDCTKFCNDSALTYTCNNEGNKVCLSRWYGDDCSVHCSTVEAVPDLYICEVSDGNAVACPDKWKTRKCSRNCIVGEDLAEVISRCESRAATTRLCSRWTGDDNECGTRDAVPKKRKADNTVSKPLILGSSVGVLLLMIAIIIMIILRIQKSRRPRVLASETTPTQLTLDCNGEISLSRTNLREAYTYDEDVIAMKERKVVLAW